MKHTFLPSLSGFLGLPTKEAVKPEDARVIVIPFGLESSVCYGGGTAKGPQAILDASPELEYFDEELWCEPHKTYRPATLRPASIRKPLPAALTQLEEIVESVLAAKKFPLILGGEHALTAGAIRPFAQRHKNLTILHFDAHADLRDGYQGQKYSHAAAMRRCLDFPNVRVVSVGIRNLSKGEADYAAKNRKRITIFWAKDRAKWKISEIVRAVGRG
ncbi:MAG: arginase family protein, partial [Patescibacteria group bacterium]